MKILSATVRNYRAHAAQAIDFDAQRTLIGGPNESGKSTFVEAIHRGLFLKATATGELRQAMLSTTYPGTPEVEIRFEVGGNEYRLTKQFKGQNGTTKLVQVGGETWLGQSAESRLASLLGAKDSGDRRATLGRIQEQWAHIWVWQGSSGNDPMSAASPEQESLLKQLQDSGGAVAMQSAKDSRVAAFFREKRGAIFTLAGAAKRGSDLADAQEGLAQAEKNFVDAEERLQRLAQAVKGFEDAMSAIEQAASDLDRLSRQQEELSGKATRLEELERVEEREKTDAQGAAEALAALEAVETSIRELRDSVRDLEWSLSPRREERERLEKQASDALRQKEDAERAYDTAVDDTRRARIRTELAESVVRRFQQATRARDLAARLERVRGLEEELGQVRRQTGELGSIDEAAIIGLREVDRALGRAAAALDAMSTEIEVLGGRGVLVGGVAIAAGDSRTVSVPTQVQIGEAATLRIYPGGGDNLRSAGDEVAHLREELRRALDSHGVQSLAQAEDLAAKKSELNSARSSLEARLKEWKPLELQETHAKVHAELVALDADVARRREQAAELWEPATPEEASGWLHREKTTLIELEAGESALRGQREALRDTLTAAERGLNDCRASVGEDERKLAVSNGQIELLIARHGSDDVRVQSLDEARRSKTEAEQSLRRIVADIAALQPEIVKGDQTRLSRAIEELQRQRQEAEIKRGANQTLLRSDGTDDPNAEAVDAKARRDRAQEHLSLVSRKAQATKLIDELFQQEQRELADRFSKPLAGKIDGYLKCLFGANAHITVEFEDNRFQGLKLARSAEDGAICFDDLSGGAKEQVAAAVRLAVAEVLAAGHDGSLPVVFDDSFAYSDPDRVQTLQRMLDLAAERGLQVIVLTCNPSDYAGLGALQAILR